MLPFFVNYCQILNKITNNSNVDEEMGVEGDVGVAETMGVTLITIDQEGVVGVITRLVKVYSAFNILVAP